MVFQKQDLAGTHYQVDGDDEQLFTGEPSRRFFNRFNSSQVLFIINSCGAWLEQFTLETGQAIEQQIATMLPLETKSEISVYNWIRQKATAHAPHIF